eukprot:gene237-15024_t
MMNHPTQPASFPLYKKVIIESGTYHGATTMQAAQKSWDKRRKALKCADASCARAAAAADVEKAGSGSPVIDGVNLQEAPYKIVEAGKHNTAVPVMLGSNRDELSMVFVVPGKYAANLT